MANEKNFKIKNGLTINGTEVISSGGAITAVGLVKLDYTNPTITFRPDNSAHFNIKANESPARLEIGHSVNKNLYLSNTGGATFNYNVTIEGDLTVNGTTTTLNTSNLNIEDKIITIADGAADAAAANESGINVDGASAQILYKSGNDRWEFNKEAFTAFGFMVGTTSTDVGLMRNNSGVFDFQAQSTRQISFSNATNGEHVRIDADGKVGIGTTSPSVKLEVNGGADAIAKITGTSTAARLDLATTTHHVFMQVIESDGRFRIYDQTAANEYLTISNAGNVGIGTNSPNRKLEVENTAGNGEVAISGTTGADLYFRPTTSYSSGGNFGIKVDGETSSPFLSTMEFSGYNNGINAIMTLKGDGKVGIGTTSPSALLDVNIDGNTGRFSRSGTQYIEISANSGGQSILSTSGTNKTLFIGTTDSNQLRLQTNGSNALSIDSSQNVGIGTTSPAGTLHIENSNVRSAVNTGADDFIIETNAYSGLTILSSNAAAGQIHFGDDGSTNIGMLQYWHTDNSMRFTVNASEQMRIDSSGRVGIGTGSPNSGTKVHIAKSGEAYARVESTSGGGARLQLKTETVGYAAYSKLDFIYGASDTIAFSINGGDTINTMAFDVGGSERMRIDSSGRLGIGTTSPSENLSIAPDTDVSAEIGRAHIGSVGHSDYAGFAHVDRNTTGHFALMQHGSGETYLNAAGGQNINFRINNSAQMILKDSGNFGIGTTNPSHRLHVSGMSKLGGIVHKNGNLVLTTSSGDNYIGTIETASNGDSSGATLTIYDGHQKATRVVYLAVRNASGTNSLDYSVKGGGGSADVDIQLKYINRSGTADKTDFYLASSGGKSYTQVYSWEAEGLIEDTGHSSTGATTIDLDDQMALMLLSNGRVGIGGTSSPTATLDINGPTKLGSGSFSGSVDTFTDTSLVLPQTKRFYSLSSSGQYLRSIFQHDGSNGHFIFGQQGTSLIADMIFYPGSSGNIRFYGSGSEDVRINASGLMGIGTTSPSKKLEVVNANSGSNFAGIQLRNNTTTANSSAELRFVISTDTTSTLNSGFIKAVRNAGDNNDLLFGTVGSERMRVLAGGQVAINSQSARTQGGTAQLTVASSGVAINIGSSNNECLYIKRTANGKYQFQTYNSGNSGDIHLQPYGGEVGIGTTNPGRQLELKGQAVIRLNGTSTDPGIDFNTDDTNDMQFRYRTSTDKLAVYSYGTSSDVLTIQKSNGYVGIGTTTPSANLQVNSSGLGNSSGDVTTQAVFRASNANNAILEIKDVRTAAGTDWTTTGKRIQMKIDSTFMGYVQFNGSGNNYGMSFGTGGTTTAPGNVSERLRIDQSGRLLIGKTVVDNATVGFRFDSASGFASFARDGGEPLYLNRKTSDGIIQKFAKDDSLVGIIGTAGGDLFIGGLDSNHAAIRFAAGSKAVLPVNVAGVLSDNTVDLGQSNAQFKDLYLGGTITGTTATFSTALDASITVQSTDATTGIVFTDNGGTGHLYYLGGSDKFYTDGKLAVNGSTLSGGMAFQVNGNSNFAGTITSNNDMAIDTDTLFVDVSTDRVGINAGTSPSYSLHVSGDIYSSDTIQTKEFQNIKLGDASIPANTAGYYKIAEVVRGTGTIQLSFTGGNHSPTTYVIHYFKNWSTSVEVKLNQYGTATHITKARIRKDSDDNDKYFVEVYFASNSNAPSFQVFHKQLDGYFNSTNQVFTGSLTAGSTNGVTYAEEDFTINGLTTERLNVTRINDNAQILVIGDTSGTTNVGIGDTSPAYALEVNEASNYAGVHIRGSNAPSLSFGRGSNSTQEWKVGLSGTNGDNFAISTGTTNADRLIIDTNGNVGIGTAPAFTLGSGLEIQRGGTTTLRLENTAASKTVEFNMGTDLEIKTLNSGSDIILTPTANVGIGTTNPGEALHIYGGDATEKLLIENTNTGTSAYATLGFQSDYSHSVNPGLFLTGSNNTNYAGANSLNMYQFGNLPLGFVTNNSLKMIIEGGGNVGIGTNDPGTLLHLYNASDPTLRIQDSSSGMIVGLQANNSSGFVGTTSNSDFDIKTNNAVRLHIENTGNVGINDTVPSKGKLQINQESNTFAAIQLTNSSQTSSNFGTYPISIFFGDEQVGSSARHQASINAVREAWSNSPAALTFKTSATVNGATEKMRITSGGDVGIGETSPTHKLHVTDNQNASTGVTIENTSDQGGNTSAAATLFLKGNTGTSEIKNYFGNLYLRTNTNHSITFFTNGANNRMSIDGSGNISVGGQTIINQARNMTNIGTISSGAISSSGTITAGSGGSASAPIITFSGDTNTGIFRTAADQLAFSAGGVSSLKLTTTKVEISDELEVSVGAGISRFSCDHTTSADDWAQSPISIRERGLVTNTQSADSYSPNLNFHWGSRVSRSLTMKADGNFILGEWTSSGAPQTGSGLSNLNLGSININNVGVIDSSRNLTNIASISVNGSAKSVFTNTSNSLIDLSSTTSGALQIGTASSTVFATIAGRQTNSGQTGLGFYSATTDANSSAVGDMHFNVRENNDTDFATLTKKAFTFRRYSSELMHLTRGGNLYVAGNVGIGTSSPSGNLHISGGSSKFRLTDTGITDANNNTLVAYAAAQNKFALGVSSTTGTSADIVIDGANDRVGIGKTPSVKLDVEGQMRCKEVLEIEIASSDDTATIQDDQFNFIKFDGANFEMSFGLDSTTLMKMFDNGALHIDSTLTQNSSQTGSDIKLKKNIKPIDNALHIINNLDGVHFNWKKDNKKSLGFIAQEVEKILPELVDEAPILNTEETKKTVNYVAIIPVLVEAIKEQQKEIERLKEHSHPAKDMCEFEGYHELMARIKKLEENNGNN